MEDAMEMAEDVLSLVLYEYEKNQRIIPLPTPIKEIETSERESVSLVMGDTMEYRKRYNNKAVKKTLTIPEWLNEEASALGVNFSQVLQEACTVYMNIKRRINNGRINISIRNRRRLWHYFTIN